MHAVVRRRGRRRPRRRTGRTGGRRARDRPRARDDVLYVASVNDPETTRLASTLATRVARPMGRTSVTREVAPASTRTSRRSTVSLASGLWVAAGFLIGVASALLRWRRRTSTPRRPSGRGDRGRRVRGPEPARGDRLPARVDASFVAMVGARLRQHRGRRRLHDRARGGARPGGRARWPPRSSCSWPARCCPGGTLGCCPASGGRWPPGRCTAPPARSPRGRLVRLLASAAPGPGAGRLPRRPARRPRRGAGLRPAPRRTRPAGRGRARGGCAWWR